jgi:hypothetical protein
VNDLVRGPDDRLRDVTKPLAIPATVTLMPASEQTRNAGPGEVLVLRCSYTVDRVDFGVAPRFVSSELARNVTIDQRLVMLTESFDDRLGRADDPERARRLQRMVALIRDMRDLDAAVAYGAAVMRDYRDDAHALNTLAWNAATTRGTKARAFPWLVEAAERAGTLDPESADVLDTVARVHYELGNLDAALVWQRKALAHRENAGDPDRIVETLNRYEREAGVAVTEVAAVVVADLPQGREVVAPYLGTFEFVERGLAFRVTATEDGRLHIEPPGQGPMALLYQGDHEFRLAAEPHVKIVFTVRDGRATELGFHQGDRVTEAVRVDGDDGS